MTLMQDNLSPYLTMVEQGSTPSNPSAGDQKLFVRTSDHVLCYLNSSGTVTPVAGSGNVTVATKGDIQTYTTVPANLGVGANGKVVTANSSATAGIDYEYPPGYEFDFASNTASDPGVTATSAATANTLTTGNAVTYDGSTIVVVDVFCPAPITDSGHSCRLCLYEDGSLKYDTISWLGASSGGSINGTVRAMLRFTPTAGSHTYSVRAYVSGGTTTFYRAGAGGSCCDIRITKV